MPTVIAQPAGAGDRETGRPPDLDFEARRATLPDTPWREGPAAVNAAIAKLLAHKTLARADEVLGRPAAEATRLELTPPERLAPLRFEMRG